MGNIYSWPFLPGWTAKHCVSCQRQSHVIGGLSRTSQRAVHSETCVRPKQKERAKASLTNSSNITSKRTRARSTESSGPVTTNSHTRSVSRPDQPALLLIPSGGVLFERDSGLLTTAMWANVWEAMSSSRRRTSGFKAGLDEGESRISERVTLIAARC